QSDQQIVGFAELLAMRALQCLQQMFDTALGALLVVTHHTDLVGIGAAVALDGERFAAPDPLRAALPEVQPPADGVLAGRAVGVAVPPFHGVDAPAVPDLKTP